MIIFLFFFFLLFLFSSSYIPFVSLCLSPLSTLPLHLLISSSMPICTSPAAIDPLPPTHTSISHHHRPTLRRWPMLHHILFFFLPLLLIGPTPLPHTADPCWPIWVWWLWSLELWVNVCFAGIAYDVLLILWIVFSWLWYLEVEIFGVLFIYFFFYWLLVLFCVKCKTDLLSFFKFHFSPLTLLLFIQSSNFQVYSIKAFPSTFIICCG